MNTVSVFKDPTFFGIFVCGPLQSFVVNVCAVLVLLLLASQRQQTQLAQAGLPAHNLDILWDQAIWRGYGCLENLGLTLPSPT